MTKSGNLQLDSQYGKGHYLKNWSPEPISDTTSKKQKKTSQLNQNKTPPNQKSFSVFINDFAFSI